MTDSTLGGTQVINGNPKAPGSAPGTMQSLQGPLGWLHWITCPSCGIMFRCENGVKGGSVATGDITLLGTLAHDQCGWTGTLEGGVFKAIT